MEVVSRAGPVPHSQHHVALDALRPRRLRGRELAGPDAIGPVRKELQGALGVEPADIGDHLGHGLAGLDAPLPGLKRRAELAKRWRNGPGRLGAEGVAAIAAVRLDDVDPLRLDLEVRRHAAISAGCTELLLLGDL